MDEQQRATFGAEVRRARKLRGWTQEELAAAAQVDAKTLSKIERGIAGTRPGIVNSVRDTLGLQLPSDEPKTVEEDLELALEMVAQWIRAAENQVDRKDRLLRLTRMMVDVGPLLHG